MTQETVARLKAHWTLVLLSTVIVYNNKSHDEDIQLHRKYGNIVRLAPNPLSIADPAEINQIYGIGTRFYKSRFYNLSTTYDDEGLVPDTFVLTDKVKLHHL